MLLSAVVLGAIGLIAALVVSLHYRRQNEGTKRTLAQLQRQLFRLQRQQHLSAMKAGYFEAIMRNNLDPIFTTDQDHLLMKINQGASDLFGFTQEEVLGKPVFHLFHDRHELQRLLKKVENKGNANTMEIRGINKNGRMVHLNLSIARMDPSIYGGQFGGCVFNCQDITKRKTIEREMHGRANELERLALTDALTGLLNRRQFEEDLKRFSELSRDNPGQLLSILVMDLDKFKQLNDTFGHQAGDQALRDFSQSILKCKRDMDPAYRFGGDEFIMLLRGADGTQSELVAKRIQDLYLQVRSPNNRTSVSIGVATFNGQESASEFFQRADDAMYYCKAQGGSTVHQA